MTKVLMHFKNYISPFTLWHCRKLHWNLVSTVSYDSGRQPAKQDLFPELKASPGMPPMAPASRWSRLPKFHCFLIRGFVENHYFLFCSVRILSVDTHTCAPPQQQSIFTFFHNRTRFNTRKQKGHNFRIKGKPLK